MKHHIAVLGAGLSGLSAAFHLSRLRPNVRITLVEKQRKSGGWVRSTRIPLPDGTGSVLLEAGPRTLRPNALSVLELVNLLELKDQLITVSKDAPAAKSRYLYIPPGHGISTSGLQRIPSSFTELLKSPLSSILVSAVAQESLKLSNRASGIQDESVDSFLRRRFGERFAETFGSAIIHGIYAADSRSISVRAAFPTMWKAEERGWGSLVRGMFIAPKTAFPSYDLAEVPKLMEGVSVYSFRDGMQTLTDTLESHVKQQRNVEVLCDATASSLQTTQDGFSVTLANGDGISASHVVSALPTPTLYRLLSPALTDHDGRADALVANQTSSVHVVNIVFPGPPSSIHPAGFGYLIPRPPTGYPYTPATERGFGILGTVFDSCSLSAQDTTNDVPDPYKEARFTKLTIMIGGPYPSPPLPSQLSSPETASGGALPQYMQTVLQQLSIHLNHELPDPLYWRIVPNKDCIPTLRPGHLERMERFKAYLHSKFSGRLEIAGAGVAGVSLGDCVEGGRSAARRLVLA